MKQLDRLHQQAFNKMNSGDSNSALELTRGIHRHGSNYIVSLIANGLLTDIGVVIGKKEIVEEGTCTNKSY